jgi:hypothetical protein
MGGERVIVRIINTNVLFVDLNTNMLAPIEGLGFSHQGVIKEFPDLKDDKDWKQKAIQRFVEKIKTLETEEKRMDFMIKEMKEMGYTPLFKQRFGFRTEKIK